MAKRKKKTHLKTKQKNEINEPVVKYGRPELVFFNSFEEMNEYDASQTLQQSPAERIRETVELILRVYGLTRESLKKRKRENIIYFDKTE